MSDSEDRPDASWSRAPWRNFYGRRHGKKLRPGQQRLLDEALSALSPGAVTWVENPERTPIDLPALFPGKREIWLEIGFGGGEHMIHQARLCPDVGIIGCEPFINGVAMLLSAIERAGVANLRVYPGDARDLMDVLPAASIARVYLLYPDPWPKTRHHKRRFINSDNLDQLAKIMAPGTELRIATDIGDYVRHSLEAISNDSRFEWVAECADDWRTPWPGWQSTRYEQKAQKEGRVSSYLTFSRLSFRTDCGGGDLESDDN